jgi:hypothetical protein
MTQRNHFQITGVLSARSTPHEKATTAMTDILRDQEASFHSSARLVLCTILYIVLVLACMALTFPIPLPTISLYAGLTSAVAQLLLVFVALA